MHNQAGFSLFELMIAIAIMAILTAVGVPAYQNYVQKAAMTDMLNAMSPYKMSVEMCFLERASLTDCSNDKNGVGVSVASQYVSDVTVTNGVIKLSGKNALSGLIATLTPELDATSGRLVWKSECATDDQKLKETCQNAFKF